MSSPTIVFIHGLNQTHLSFSHWKNTFPENGISTVDYESRQPLADSIVQVSKALPKKEELVLVGHSLGGVVSTLIALNKTHNVKKVVTISSPLGGSKAAVYARWIVGGIRVFSDITPTSPSIQRLVKEVPPCPVLSLISVAGSFLNSNEPNDGIVTVASQKALPYAKKVEIKANHFEVLMHDKTVETIKKFVQ